MSNFKENSPLFTFQNMDEEQQDYNDLNSSLENISKNLQSIHRHYLSNHHINEPHTDHSASLNSTRMTHLIDRSLMNNSSQHCSPKSFIPQTEAKLESGESHKRNYYQRAPPKKRRLRKDRSIYFQQHTFTDDLDARSHVSAESRPYSVRSFIKSDHT